MSRRLPLIGGLFALLVLILVAFPPSDERQPPLTVYSAEPGGGKALRLWLEALGYSVTTLEGDRYQPGRELGVIVILQPTRSLDRDPAARLEQWVRAGGRLVVADGTFRTSELLRRFGVSARLLRGEVITALPTPDSRLDPAIQALRVEPNTELLIEAAGRATPLLIGTPSEDAPPSADGPAEADNARSRRPILAAHVPVDRGELLVLTAPDLLSNASLHDEANARLALSLVGPPGRGQVAFDELHHGFGALRNRSLYALLLDQAWGRTLFLAGGLVLLFLLWSGRRFGRAVPPFVDRGRSLGELVTSQAALYRAGGKRAFAADHLERQLRHDVTQAIGLPGDASNERVVAHARALGRNALPALRVLADLRHAESDGELLALTRAGERALARLARQRAAGAAPREKTRPPTPSHGPGPSHPRPASPQPRGDEERR